MISVLNTDDMDPSAGFGKARTTNLQKEMNPMKHSACVQKPSINFKTLVSVFICIFLTLLFATFLFLRNEGISTQKIKQQKSGES